MRRRSVASATSGASGAKRTAGGVPKAGSAFHSGKVEIECPRVRGFDGAECVSPSWESGVSEDLLGKWATNQMLKHHI